jgi:hypothetical protein
MGRLSSSAADLLMCASMNLVQARHRLHRGSRDEMETYVNAHERMTPQAYYAIPEGEEEPATPFDTAPRGVVTWRSPIRTRFPRNDIARADLYPCAQGWPAPTVIMLHALMSANDIGYRRWAARFNEQGWNACFLHLPFHYSRVPRGHWNGELAITADLIRNAEGVRQGVIEVRQLLAALRKQGGTDFGLLATSYGGWIGALVASVEKDLRFVALMAPIVDVHHALWESGAAMSMRFHLRRAGVEPGVVSPHYRLSSPSHTNAMDPARVVFASGDFDLIARPKDIETLHRKWSGSRLLRIPQGHFGYRMMRDTFANLQTWAL